MDNQVSQYQSLPGNMLYNNLISNIEQGQIKIPQFQRKFVWSIEETAGLIDSILKGYPIGTFIIWETNDRLRSVRNIGNFQFPDTPDGNTVQYVLDGQQRMTSLYVALRGAKLEDDNGQITGVTPKFCVKSNECRNRAKFICRRQRLDRLPPMSTT